MMPKGMGGLAIRDLEKVNQALLLKALWKLASNAESQWVKLVRAKYIPNRKLWLSKRTYRCTNFWRGIMHLREKLLEMIHWHIGDGKGVHVFGEPWFQNALQYSPTCALQASMTVNQITKEGEEGWDVEKNYAHFGESGLYPDIGELRSSKVRGGTR